ncbi:INNER MEMBRANE LOCALIZED PROTEIN [Salix viminalis]|uniref:INNER MEMBRANE LOCALIZED PROTEIN n=2 Tax=Salix TaxID=40685 RepID=A0A6N2LYS1_SALVM|nr:INNER MEMBRANE LOCALIZED PROTEIN [Salix viminalis]
MTVLSTPLLSIKTPQARFLASGSSLKPKDQCLLCISPGNISSKGKLATRRRSLTIQASGDHGGSSGAGIFIGGFILGGILAGTFGCVFAPQISKTLAGADRKDLMRKLPKFIYDEDKALEKTRQVLSDKIAQLNSAIDEVSAQLHPEDAPNGIAVASDEIQASI